MKQAQRSLAVDGVERKPNEPAPAAIVLLSDGAQNRGRLQPLQAAEQRAPGEDQGLHRRARHSRRRRLVRVRALRELDPRPARPDDHAGDRAGDGRQVVQRRRPRPSSRASTRRSARASAAAPFSARSRRGSWPPPPCACSPRSSPRASGKAASRKQSGSLRHSPAAPATEIALGSAARAQAARRRRRFGSSSSRRMRTSEATMPTTAMTSPAMNAAEKPSTAACAWAVPDAIASEVRDVAIVESAAMPSAPPICCDVLISPDARPISFSRTPASAAIEIGTNEKPSPTPTSRKPGSRSVRYEPSTETCVNQASPPASAVMPVTSTGFTPSRSRAAPRRPTRRSPCRRPRGTRRRSSSASSRAPAACRASASGTSRRSRCRG